MIADWLVGAFHSTKIIEFTMYCHLCGNPIKCETDPENCDYKFTLGAYRIVKNCLYRKA